MTENIRLEIVLKKNRYFNAKKSGRKRIRKIAHCVPGDWQDIKSLCATEIS